jgi:hypothetical protein
MDTTIITSLPKELVDIIFEYIPFCIMHTVCKRSNEHRIALKNAPNQSTWSIHIAIQRFHWRWITSLSHKQLSTRSYPLLCDKKTATGNTRESEFISDTLKFHSKWTGPPIPYEGYEYGDAHITNEIFHGSQ